MPLRIYNIIDQKVEEKYIKINPVSISNLYFIQSLVKKIETAKKENLAEEF